MDNRPTGREKHITGVGKDVRKGTQVSTGGPVGRQDGYQGRPQSGAGGGQRATRAGGKSPLLTIIIIAVMLLGGGGAGLSGLLGGGDVSAPVTPSATVSQQYSGTSSVLSGLLSGGYTGNGTTSSGWDLGANVGRLNTDTVTTARAKRTTILGGGRDTINLMVYMCGADLESRGGMATNDLQEMLDATIGDNVNLIIYTGGAKQWRNNVISSGVNQIYQVTSKGLVRLVDDDGSRAMTSPATLTRFIQYCAKNFPDANRNMLIFWDHGGGSISGYGYDEKYASAGSISLQGINEALGATGVTFDMIGFDTCLMATLENALMLDQYGDYLVASEETEPGVGWYYTNWLTKLSKNTSMPTTELGKNIIDDFVSVCAQKCPGQKTTLSLVDLAELSATVPVKLNDFAESTTALLQANKYTTVSNARGGAREFAASNHIDQVDLVHMAGKMGTSEGTALAKALLSAIKYNKTSSDMTNAYGLSIFFPYQSKGKVNSAVATYNAIGMDDEYSRCIRQFASMASAGQQISGGGSSSMFSQLLGGSSAMQQVDTEQIASLLMTLLGDSGRSMDVDSAARFLAENRFDPGQLVWLPEDGTYVLRMSDDQWDLVHDLQLNVFLDDGEGYLDMGLDNVFFFTADGGLLGEFDGTWLAIDDQPVAYYYMDTVYDGGNYTITGRVPVLLNDQRAELLLVFDTAHPYGYIAGARDVYVDGETDTLPKSFELEEGDEIVFLCDYYGYDGQYQGSYTLGEPLTYSGDHQISNVYLTSPALASYLFTDIYAQEYWTPSIPQ